MQPSRFDRTEAHPLRQPGQIPVGGRIGAVVITALAHLVVVFALVVGLVAPELRTQDISVALVPQRRVVKEPPPDFPGASVQIIPAFSPPVPEFNVSPAPAGPAPPMMLPSPPSANPQASNAGPTWETALLTKLAQTKHMPASAPHGVVLLRFTMDRDGKVLKAAIEKSSGTPALDQEALAALQRAQPLPMPPAEVTGDPLELIVPIDFF